MTDTITDKYGVIYSGVFLHKEQYILHGKDYFINGKKNGLFTVQITNQISYIIYEDDKIVDLY